MDKPHFEVEIVVRQRDEHGNIVGRGGHEVVKFEGYLNPGERKEVAEGLAKSAKDIVG